MSQDAVHAGVGSERLEFAVQAAEAVLRSCLREGADGVSEILNTAKHITEFPDKDHQRVLDILRYISQFHRGSGKFDLTRRLGL